MALLHFRRKYLVVVFVLAALLSTMAGAIAYNTGVPADFGHTLGEIKDSGTLCRSNGDNCPQLSVDFFGPYEKKNGNDEKKELGAQSKYTLCALSASGWYYHDYGNDGRGGRGSCEITLEQSAGQVGKKWYLTMNTEQAYNGITCGAVCVKKFG